MKYLKKPEANQPKENKQYLAEKYESDLGKVDVGKSCIRFKKIEDLIIETVKKVLKEAAKTPGLIGA
jgi:hypothetical protein